MGCVLPAGLGQAPARQAAIKAGLPKSVQATTVNKVCGSGMQTVIMAEEALKAGNADLIVAGGMESMTNAPYLLKKHRSGARIGHDTAYDHMFLDGLEDAYEPGRAMGTFAQDTADQYQLTREEHGRLLDREPDARQGGDRQRRASRTRSCRSTIKGRGGETVVDTDEAPGRGRPDKIPTAEARLRQGRHHHRRDQLVDLRRRRRAGADPPVGRRGQGAEAGRPHRRQRRSCPRAGASSPSRPPAPSRRC